MPQFGHSEYLSHSLTLSLPRYANEEDRLQVLHLRVSVDSVVIFQETLISDFGGLTAESMQFHQLLTGPHGLDGFMSLIIDELLDSLPTTHENYQSLFDLLGPFCGQLARKMRNWKKVGVSDSKSFRQFVNQNYRVMGNRKRVRHR